MQLLNCTPHALTLLTAEGERLTLPPSGHVARVIPGPRMELAFGDLPVPVYHESPGTKVEGLPAVEPGVLCVVSAVVLSALRGQRPDLVGPGTGPADNPERVNGQVTAVRCLVR